MSQWAKRKGGVLVPLAPSLSPFHSVLSSKPWDGPPTFRVGLLSLDQCAKVSTDTSNGASH